MNFMKKMLLISYFYGSSTIITNNIDNIMVLFKKVTLLYIIIF